MDIIKQFNEAYPIHQHSHAIIDRIIYPDLPEEWDASPIVTEITAPQAHLYPFLVELSNILPKQMPILENMISESNKKSGILLIKSHFDYETLTYLLANALIYSSKLGENYLLRYYDYNVLLQLLRLIPTRNLFNKLKSLGIEYLTFYSQYGKKTYLPHEGNLQLEQKDNNILNKLLNIGIINNSIKKLNYKIDLSEYFKISDFLENKIFIARNEYLLTDTNDISSFIIKCILVHDFYYQSPKIERLLKESSLSPGYFHENLALIDSYEWDSIFNFCEKKHNN